MAKELTPHDLNIVQTFINERIIAGGKTMTSKQIYAKLKDQLGVAENAFSGLLSASVRSGDIKGIVGRKRAGYSAGEFHPPTEKGEKEEKSTNVKEQKPYLTPAPSMVRTNHPRYLWIDKNMFSVPRSSSDLDLLVSNVLNGKRAKEGNVVFGGKVYKVDCPDILEKFLTTFMFASKMGEREPILDDGSGLTVEFRIDSDMV